MPFHAGDALAEPLPSSADVRVLQEDLQIDLRPLEQNRRAVVHARYQLQNDAAARQLGLFFAAPRPHEVRLLHAGKQLTGRAETPATPGSRQGTSFDVPLRAGAQWLDVEYPVEGHLVATGMVAGTLLTYDMAPAQHWREHAGIAIRVRLPAGFQVLERPSALSAASESNTYAGHVQPGRELVAHQRSSQAARADRLDDQPATLRLHVAPSAEPYYWQSVAQFISWGLALLVPLYMAWRLRRFEALSASRPSVATRVRSLLVCSVFVVLLPWFLVGPLARWLPHRTASLLPAVGLFVSVLLGGLLSLLGHTLLGRRSQAPALPERTLEQP